MWSCWANAAWRTMQVTAGGLGFYLGSDEG